MHLQLQMLQTESRTSGEKKNLTRWKKIKYECLIFSYHNTGSQIFNVFSSYILRIKKKHVEQSEGRPGKE